MKRIKASRKLLIFGIIFTACITLEIEASTRTAVSIVKNVAPKITASTTFQHIAEDPAAAHHVNHPTNFQTQSYKIPAKYQYKTPNKTKDLQEYKKRSEKNEFKREIKRKIPSETMKSIEISVRKRPTTPTKNNTNTAIINRMTESINKKIDILIEKYQSLITEHQFVQKIKNSILDEILMNQESTGSVFYDADMSIIIFENIQKIYKENSNIQYAVLQSAKTLVEKLHDFKISKWQTNRVITQYYTQSTREQIIKFMNQPLTIITTPEIQEIIQKIKNSPSQASYNMLKTLSSTLDATIHAYQYDKTILGDSPLLTELKTYRNQLTQLQQSPEFTQFQSWNEYFNSYIPTQKAVLKQGIQMAGIEEMSLQKAFEHTESMINNYNSYAPTSLQLDNIQNITVKEAINRSGIAPNESLINTSSQNIAQSWTTEAINKITNFIIENSDIGAIKIKDILNQADTVPVALQKVLKPSSLTIKNTILPVIES